MDSGIRVATCKTGGRRLLDEVFESKPIKRGGKFQFNQPKKLLDFEKALITSMKWPHKLSLPTTSPRHPPPLTLTFQESSTIWTKPK